MLEKASYSIACDFKVSRGLWNITSLVSGIAACDIACSPGCGSVGVGSGKWDGKWGWGVKKVMGKGRLGVSCKAAKVGYPLKLYF